MKKNLPDEVRKFVGDGEKVERAVALASGWIVLTDRALYCGRPFRRIPRREISGIEFDRKGVGPGAMIFVGAGGELARAEFDGLVRRELAKVEKALAPRRKILSVYLEQEVYAADEEIRGELVLDWPKKAQIRGIRIGLSGAEETRITVSEGSGEHETTTTYTETHAIVDRALRLFGRPHVSWYRAAGEALARIFSKSDYPELPAGRHRYPFAFRLPEDALPTYVGTHVEVAYRLWAHVDVPLGFDLASEETIQVGFLSSARVAPHAFRTARKGRGLLKGLHADLSMDFTLEETPYRAGERLKGTLRIVNASKKRIRGVDIRLTWEEHAEAGSHTRDVAEELSSGFLPAPDPSASCQDVRFEIPIARPLVHYHGRLSSVLLWMVAEVDVALGINEEFRFPLTILP